MKDSLFNALKKCDVGAFGIKPFANNSLFEGSSAPDNPHAEEDDRRARLTIRRILHNPHIIPIPGLVSTHQVENVAKAVKERRELDLAEAGDEIVVGGGVAKNKKISTSKPSFTNHEL